jgi:hypothetical protein
MFRLDADQEDKREQIESGLMKRIAENQRDARAFTYHYPRNKEEWGKNVETWWPELLALIGNYGPNLGKPIDPLASLQPAAVRLEEMKRAKDMELASILERTWAAAPDHGSIHANKGWDVLCDLCSESYVLYDEPEL